MVTTTDSPAPSPTSGIWRILAPLISLPHLAESAVDDLVGTPKRAIMWLEKREHNDQLAYWDWIIGACMPDALTCATPAGTYRIRLARRSEDRLSTAAQQRVIQAMSAGCSLDGARANIHTSTALTTDAMASPMPADVIETTDPVDVARDLLVTQGVDRSNVPLVTGATFGFVNACVGEHEGTSLDPIRAMWDVASRAGCTMSLTFGKRIYRVLPATKPNQELAKEIAKGVNVMSIPKEYMASPRASRVVAGLLDGSYASVQAAAAEAGVSHQAISKELSNFGITAAMLKTLVRTSAARKALRHLAD